MAADASFYDKNWTLLNKINGIADWLKENNIDLTNWHWKNIWISGASYVKFDVVSESYYDSLLQRGFENVYICINDVAGSSISPRLDTVNWKRLFAIPVPDETKLYNHSIEMTKSGTKVSFSYISSESTPFTFATFAAKYPSATPLKVSAGYVYTSSVYQGPITTIFNMSGLVVNYIIAGGNSTSMVVINSTDTFNDSVEVL